MDIGLDIFQTSRVWYYDLKMKSKDFLRDCVIRYFLCKCNCSRDSWNHVLQLIIFGINM